MGKIENNLFNIFLILMWLTIAKHILENNGNMIIILVLFFICIVIGAAAILITKVESEYGKSQRSIIKYTNDVEFKSVFDEVYKEFSPKLKVLNKQIKISFILSVMIFATAFMCSISNQSLFVILAIVGAYFIIIAYIKYHEYTVIYKKKVVDRFIKSIDSRLNFSDTISREEIKSKFIDSRFKENYFTTINVDDCITANIEGCEMVFSEVTLNAVLKVDKTTKNVKVFEGAFANIELDKDIDFELIITRNERFIEKILNRDNRPYQDLKKFELDSALFEEYFDIYTTNEIEAMRILTHDVMDKLVEFAAYNIEFEIAIRNNHLYIIFNTGSMFEPRLSKEPMDIDLLYTYYFLFLFIVLLTGQLHNVMQEYIP